MLAVLFYNETTSNEKVKRNPIDFNENYTIPEDFDGYLASVSSYCRTNVVCFSFYSPWSIVSDSITRTIRNAIIVLDFCPLFQPLIGISWNCIKMRGCKDTKRIVEVKY